MKIVGTGIDIVEIERIRRLAKREPKFLERVFGPQELAYAFRGKKWAERLAVRFAAKEAVWKALGLTRIPLNAICVSRLDNGKPLVDLKPLKVPRSWRAEIALSHSDRYAVAHCMIYSAS